MPMFASPMLASRKNTFGNSLVLLAGWALLVTGCVTPRAGIGGGGPGGGEPPGLLPPGELEAAAEAEAALAFTQVKAMASVVREEQASLTFTFWVERGAFTLTAYSAQRSGGTLHTASARNSLDDALRTVVSRYARGSTGEMRVVVRRNGVAWSVDGRIAHQEPRPAEAKTLPVQRSGMPAAVVQSLTRGVKGVLSEVRIPEGGAVVAEVEVRLEDDRVEHWSRRSLRTVRLGTGDELLEPTRLTLNEVAWVLLPFTQGVGARTVRLTLHLEHRLHEAQVRSWVAEASVERPLPVGETNAAFVSEYRKMHELILRRWREETREGAEWVARQGVEQAAYWYAGGILFKGGAYLAGWAGSVMRRALGRGGEAAAGWLRTSLTRLPGEDKKVFEQLWRKVQLEGERALSRGERGKLRELMETLEKAVQARLIPAEKKKIRESAREYYKKLRPDLARLLDEGGSRLPIHHRRQMEYAHLFPDEDINAAHQLAMVRSEVHTRLNSAWARFRELRPAPTAKEVDDAARIIDQQFEAWYHQAEVLPNAAKTLDTALDDALRGLQRLFPK